MTSTATPPTTRPFGLTYGGETLEELRTENYQVIAENSTLVRINTEQQARIEHLEGRIVGLLRQVGDLYTQVTGLLNLNDTLEQQLDSLRAELEQLQS